MSIKLLTVAALSLALAGPAFAQTSTTQPGSGQTGAGGTNAPATTGGVSPTEFEGDDRGVFFDDTANAMRSENDARTRFSAMAPERQQAIRDACVTYRQNIAPGSADLTNTQSGNQTDPVPGVFNMGTACQWTQNF